MNINLRLLSSKFQAFKNCVACNNIEWKDKHEDSINDMLELLPSGSGLDAGVKFDWVKSTKDKLFFNFGYHHMDEHGGYDGWTSHELILIPSFAFGYDMRITGKDKNGIKEYLSQLFSEVFTVDEIAG